MNIQTLKSVLPVLMRNRVVPFIWGSQGIGKTQSVKQVADSMGSGFVHLHMANLEVGDLVGLLVKRDDGTVYHARPEWFPVDGDSKPATGIIFLDELNRMHPDVMQAMFSFVNGGIIHTHKLKKGWAIVAAGNYQSGDFQVTDTSDAAWMSRFCHIDLKPTVEEFTLHADKSGAAIIADFITDHQNMLERSSETRFDFGSVTPDRRAWLQYIAPLEAESMDEAIRYELYQGLVGPAAASSFQTFKKTSVRSVSLKQILANFDKYEPMLREHSSAASTRFDLLNKPIDELMTRLVDDKELVAEAGKLENLKKFIILIPLELSQRVFKDLAKLSFTNKDQLLNDMEFLKQAIVDKAPVETVKSKGKKAK